MSKLKVVERLEMIKKRIEELAKKELVVGALGDAEYEDGLSNADLLAIHEFGAEIDHPGGTRYSIDKTGKSKFLSNSFVGPAHGVTSAHKIIIPERPVMRTAFKKSQDDAKKLLSKSVSECLNGDISTDMVYERAGMLLRNVILDTFTNNDFKPNTAETVRRKKSTKPLIDTGALRGSINYEVRERE